MAEKVSRDRGYRSDTIAISPDMGPLSGATKNGGSGVNARTNEKKRKIGKGGFVRGGLGYVDTKSKEMTRLVLTLGAISHSKRQGNHVYHRIPSREVPHRSRVVYGRAIR